MTHLIHIFLKQNNRRNGCFYGLAFAAIPLIHSPMNTSWLKDCELLDFINVDISFCINEDFYYGPHDVISIAERKETTPLPSVTNKAAETHNFRSLKAEQYAEQLLEYYEEVQRLAKNYGRQDWEINQYFWLKLTFSRGDKGLSMNFPCYDTLDEMAPILEKIGGGKDGVILQDEDMDWFADIYAQDGFIYAREGDPEENEISFMQKIPRERFGIDCLEALERTRSLIEYLSGHLKKDYWAAPKFPPGLFTE